MNREDVVSWAQEVALHGNSSEEDVQLAQRILGLEFEVESPFEEMERERLREKLAVAVLQATVASYLDGTNDGYPPSLEDLEGYSIGAECWRIADEVLEART